MERMVEAQDALVQYISDNVRVPANGESGDPDAFHVALSVDHRGFAVALRRSAGPIVFEGCDEESGTDAGAVAAK